MSFKDGFKASQHMEGFLDPRIREKRIEGALQIIKSNDKYGLAFDAIAYRGASGAITASIIAHRLKRALILVRKPEDCKGHSPFSLEGPRKVYRYLIVDDFMSSGNTYEAIREAVKHAHADAECLGMLEVAYAEDGGSKNYRKSHVHEEEILRDKRIAKGQATKSDLKWASRDNASYPDVIYKPVCIFKDKDTYKFEFESNQQKFLPKPPDPTDFVRDFFRWIKPLPVNVPVINPEGLMWTAIEWQQTNPFPYQYTTFKTRGENDQKAQEAAQAGLPATEG